MTYIEIGYYMMFFIIGAIFGSFYHVVGYRLPKNESLLKPRFSYCANCRQRLKWYELIPLLSFVLQGGKCRYCRQPISTFYPAIEFITGILFVVSFYSFGFSYQLVIALVLVSLFSIVIVSDLYYLMIPDEVTLASILVIAMAIFFGQGYEMGLRALGSGVLLFGVMYLIMLLGDFILKKESLGGADIKLMFVAGLVLDPVLGVGVIFLSSVIALPISLIIYLVDRENVIPFGPFIVASILILFLLKIDVTTFFNLFLL
ncbi:MAG: prepilin peptidase [bacterium]|nr:prepilin peptidase [bacterium]